jgi:hypothetical protein
MLGSRFCYPLCDHLECWSMSMPYPFDSGTPRASIPRAYRAIPLIA